MSKLKHHLTLYQNMFEEIKYAAMKSDRVKEI